MRMLRLIGLALVLLAGTAVVTVAVIAPAQAEDDSKKKDK